MVPVVKKVAEDEFADLIVIGTMAASGWKEMLVGSNTERVIRHAPCPVLVIPAGVQELKIDRVLVPTTCFENRQTGVCNCQAGECIRHNGFISSGKAANISFISPSETCFPMTVNTA